jgi:hypothetical protein
MKKILLAGFSILIGLQLFANTDPTTSLPPVGPVISPVSPDPAVSERLMKTFKESFPNAEKVIWDKSQDFYTVSFVQQGILNRITYEKNGDFASAIRYYTERNLPYYLIDVVKNKYTREKIYGVTEVTTPAGILYYIKLESPKYWLTILLDSEGVSTVQDKYRKAL